jgi:uncharacterized protein (TIGR00730 family)
MADRPPRRRTGDPELDRRLIELLDRSSASAADRDLLFEMLVTVVRLADDDPGRLNLKITNAALKEMRQAFRVFRPFREVPKITIFGSARTRPEDPLYVQARDLAATLARQGWMVVTGAGPGIMAAGAEGAGPDRSIGVNIRLPFEDANPFIAADPKLVSMKYFFTRKLMLMKESAGFVVLPGGFGTMDETFELLTLLQTGKAAPAPLVLLDVPGGTYWRAFDHFIRQELAARAMVSADDDHLFHMTEDVEDAAAEILGFYRNYHSMRFVGPQLVIRMRSEPTNGEVEGLGHQFSDIVASGVITKTDPLPAEVADDDNLALPRLVLAFDRMRHGRLRAFIDALNRLPSAPPAAAPDLAAAEAAGTPPGAAGSEEPAEVTPEPVLADLLGQAAAAVAGGHEQAVLVAASALMSLLAGGAVDDAQQHGLAAELCHLSLTAPSGPARLALLDALAETSPFVTLSLLLELLLDHRDALGDEGTATLVRALDRMLEVTAAAPPEQASPVVLLLRMEEPGPVLDQLAAHPDRTVATSARAARGRLDRLLAGRPAAVLREPSPRAN